jgi:hypothetical protein
MKRAIFAMALVLALPAFSMSLEISSGLSNFTESDKGIWWQPGPASEGFSTSMDLDSKSITIGVSGYATDWAKWRVGYAHLGKVSTKAWATSDDLDYDFDGQKCRPGCTMAYYHAKGSVQGVYALLAPEIRSGNWSAFVEGGAWVYVPKFEVGDDVLAPNKIEEKLTVGAVAGLGVGYKNVSLVARAYRVDPMSVSLPANYQGYAKTFGVQYTLNFWGE